MTTARASTDQSAQPRPELILLGSGGHAAVIAECARRVGHTIVAVASQESIDCEAVFAGATWLGDPDSSAIACINERVAAGARLVAAVGDGAVRARWFARYGDEAFVTVIDPSAVVSPSALLSAGVFIAPLAVVNARARLSRGCIVNTSAIIEHDCRIGEFAHISPAAVLCGSVEVGALVHVGAAAVVIPNRAIGANAIIGAGAVVIRDVPASATAVGVPASSRAHGPHDSGARKHEE